MTSEGKKKEKSSPYSDKMGHLKGHVSVKSNAYSPTCKRLSSQDMVVDNMMMHARKVNTAKSRIDNSLPKSWTSSIVKRDQMRRQALARGATPSSSASRLRSSSSAPVSPAKLEHYLDGSLTAEDMEILSDIYGDNRLSQYNTPRSLKSTGHRRPMSGMNGRTSQVIQTTTRNPSHDLLDTRATNFTEGGHAHTPRTLRTTAKSRLAQSKYYNPPKRKEKRQTAKGEAEDYDDHLVNGENPNETRDKRSTKHDRHPEDAGTKRNEDHIRWMEDQAVRVQQLRLDDTQQDINGDETMNSTLNNPAIYSARLETMSYRSKSQNEKRMREEEEELKYLEFVTDVTNDVLNRGIFSNAVLKQVFDAHIDRNKDKLNEERMRKLMKQLKGDLAIPDDL